MRLPSKPVWVLIGVHTVSLIVGFWFLYQLIVSSVERQAVETGCDDLSPRVKRIAELSNTVLSDDLKSGTLIQTRLQSLSNAARPTQGIALLLASRDWTTLGIGAGADADRWRVGDRVAWQSESTSDSPGQPIRGLIRMSDHRGRAAVAFPVADGTANLVIYEPAPLAPAWMVSLLASLPMAVGIAFLWTWVLATFGTVLVLARRHVEETNLQAQHEHDALRSAQDLLRTRDAVIFGLAKLAESRDPETGHHLERISLYSTRLATALRSLPKYQRVVTPSFVRLLGISSVLHDIGKVGLEDTVLLKPGKLTEAERKKMQQHTLVAGECLKEIEQRLGASNFLQTAREIALYHHERWDGTGYPTGLVGEQIPLAARIVTIADVYDALSSKRVYKDAFPHEDCVQLIRAGVGSQFDPELVDVFLKIQADFAAIAQQFASMSRAEANPTSAPDDEGNQHMTPEQEDLLLNVVAELKSNPSSALSTHVA